MTKESYMLNTRHLCDNFESLSLTLEKNIFALTFENDSHFSTISPK
jgi:hypothetical protein